MEIEKPLRARTFDGVVSIGHLGEEGIVEQADLSIGHRGRQGFELQGFHGKRSENRAKRLELPNEGRRER